MTYDAKHDVFVSVCSDLPPRVKGLITVDRDGNNIILINEYLSDDAASEALEHEYQHLSRNDLYSDEPAHILEGEVDDDSGTLHKS